MSGGQQQRVAIARALAMEPQVMMFDEATSALDPELVKGVLELIADLAAHGMTMLVVTHEMGFARRVSDLVAIIDHGRVVEAGPPEQIFYDPHHPRQQRFLAECCNRGPGWALPVAMARIRWLCDVRNSLGIRRVPALGSSGTFGR